MKSNLKKILCGLILFFNGYALAAESPSDMQAWEVGIVSPSLYPVEVERSYGINEEDNWTSLMHSIRTMGKYKLENIRRFDIDYEGYAIPLITIGTSTARQRLPTRTLPDSMYIYWASLAEHKMYVSKFDLTDKIKAEMMSGGKWRGRQPGGSHCYKNLIVFGLLPGGEAKVWLSGCDTYTYVGKVSAIKETDAYPRNNIYLELVSENVKQFAADNNMQLFPIPKDKIDKVLLRGRYEVLK